jgi:hypothetical protein
VEERRYEVMMSFQTRSGEGSGALHCMANVECITQLCQPGILTGKQSLRQGKEMRFLKVGVLAVSIQEPVQRPLVKPFNASLCDSFQTRTECFPLPLQQTVICCQPLGHGNYLFSVISCSCRLADCREQFALLVFVVVHDFIVEEPNCLGGELTRLAGRIEQGVDLFKTGKAGQDACMTFREGVDGCGRSGFGWAFHD